MEETMRQNFEKFGTKKKLNYKEEAELRFNKRKEQLLHQYKTKDIVYNTRGY